MKLSLEEGFCIFLFSFPPLSVSYAVGNIFILEPWMTCLMVPVIWWQGSSNLWEVQNLHIFGRCRRPAKLAIFSCEWRASDPPVIFQKIILLGCKTKIQNLNLCVRGEGGASTWILEWGYFSKCIKCATHLGSFYFLKTYMNSVSVCQDIVKIII